MQFTHFEYAIRITLLLDWKYHSLFAIGNVNYLIVLHTPTNTDSNKLAVFLV